MPIRCRITLPYCISGHLFNVKALSWWVSHAYYVAFVKQSECLYLSEETRNWSEVELNQKKLFQREENISWLAARGVNHSWPRPHAVPFSDSVTYSSSSRRYLCTHCYLKPPKFLTLYQTSGGVWWLQQMAKMRRSRLCEAAQPRDFRQPIIEEHRF